LELQNPLPASHHSCHGLDDWTRAHMCRNIAWAMWACGSSSTFLSLKIAMHNSCLFSPSQPTVNFLSYKINILLHIAFIRLNMG
jgi:hypothetical protein